ncbi:hypothetical protein AB0K51_26490 [Kitasatospora sp. NPDC049285]|uniref:hypothetical protein n=1 Tax=Kitasatospora sp. NPDC049285 TaxID=3157096 RepID=UPI0034278DF5
MIGADGSRAGPPGSSGTLAGADRGLLGANRALRVAVVVLLIGGLALHLWLGSRLPLLAVVAALLCHLGALLTARRLLRRGNRRVVAAVGGGGGSEGARGTG